MAEGPARRTQQSWIRPVKSTSCTLPPDGPEACVPCGPFSSAPERTQSSWSVHPEESQAAWPWPYPYFRPVFGHRDTSQVDSVPPTKLHPFPGEPWPCSLSDRSLAAHQNRFLSPCPTLRRRHLTLRLPTGAKRALQCSPFCQVPFSRTSARLRLDGQLMLIGLDCLGSACPPSQA